MSFTRPSLSELITRARGDLTGRFPGADSRLRRAVIEVLARIWAGLTHGLYGALADNAKQVMPDSADDEHAVRWASIWGVPRKSAAAASGQVTYTGVEDTPIGGDAKLQSGGRATYTPSDGGIILGGLAPVTVTADQPGAGGNLAPGSTLYLASPIGGLAPVAIVGEGGITGGIDEESIPSLIGRLLGRIREQPQGGADADYRRWALEVPQVTRVWPIPNYDGAGSVGVTFVCDGREDIIPTLDDVAAVVAHIDPLRPVTAEVVVFAPTPNDLDLTIHPVPNTAAVKAAITASLQDLLRREAAPGATILISHIREAVSSAQGETDNAIATPTADVTQTSVQIARLGVITWD